MKKLITIIIFCIAITGYSQDTTIKYFDGWKYVYIKGGPEELQEDKSGYILIDTDTSNLKVFLPKDTINSICAKRGHMMSPVVTKTLAYDEPYLEETDSTTVMVYPSCNWIKYTCMRCGERVTEKAKEKRVVVSGRVERYVGITPNKTPMIEQQLLSVLEKYETDCYNDSTAKYYVTLSDGIESWDKPCHKGDTIWMFSRPGDVMICPEHWHHKQPTFKGFIQWLRKRQ